MTFHHIVAITWPRPIPDRLVSKLSSTLDRLSEECQEIKSYSHGPDTNLREGNGDYGIAAEFENSAAWSEYDKHPTHLVAKQVLSESAAEYVVVQFED